jgi:hypothetical protein
VTSDLLAKSLALNLKDSGKNSLNQNFAVVNLTIHRIQTAQRNLIIDPQRQLKLSLKSIFQRVKKKKLRGDYSSSMT